MLWLVFTRPCVPPMCIRFGSTWPSFLQKAQISQIKIVRRIFWGVGGKFDCVNEHLSSLKMLNFEPIHEYFSLSLIYKMQTSYSGTYIIRLVDNSHQTRSSNLDLMCPPFRTAVYNNSILCAGPKLFNSLPPNKKNIKSK